MSNVFSKSNNVNNHPNRNVYDFSFTNNLTGKFGTLYPVMCEEVIPSTSCKFKPTFGLQFMPLAFPVQTNVRAYLHFFYVRNRNLWKDFPDYMAKTKDNLVRPYIDCRTQSQYDSMFRTGSLGDYLGIPTTYVGGEYGTETLSFAGEAPVLVGAGNAMLLSSDSISQLVLAYQDKTWNTYWGNNLSSFSEGASKTSSDGPNTYAMLHVIDTIVTKDGSYPDVDTVVLWMSMREDVLGYTENSSRAELYAEYKEILSQTADDTITTRCNRLLFPTLISATPVTSSGDDFVFHLDVLNGLFTPDGEVLSSFEYVFDDTNYQIGIRLKFSDTLKTLFTTGSMNGGFLALGLLTFGLDRAGQKVYIGTGYLTDMYDDMDAGFFLGRNPFQSSTYFSLAGSSYTLYFPFRISTGGQVVPDGSVTDVPFEETPFYSSTVNPDGEMLNVEPFRAYEAIYNAFYRDPRNNPYILNGEPEYNKFIPTNEGGADVYTYKLHQRNWEQDFLTTAVQSPQQGIAPLVGIVSGEGLTSVAFSDPETGEVFSGKLTQNEDGTTHLDVTPTDQQFTPVRSLIDVTNQGISINDFRNVNAMQRWLEMNMRKGYRLRDIIKGHYDVDVRYDELDMPEFLGGISQDIRTSMVTQTSADQEGSPLGSYAGQMNCLGSSRRSIRKYFDEPGYLVGILSVVPVPSYSQLLPTKFTRRDVLDMYFPEFGHIGFQPITYKNVCPIQAHMQGTPLSTVFGYQRPWWDYISKTDEVHGLMRTSLRDFLINRVFKDAPQLSEDFLLVDPAQTNNIFTVQTESDDVFVGQIYFDMQIKQPIPMSGVARLE